MAALVISEMSDDGLSLTRIVPVTSVDSVEVNLSSKTLAITTKTGSVVEAQVSDEIKISCGDRNLKTSSEELVLFLTNALS